MVFRNCAAHRVPGKSESSARSGFNVVISIAAPLARGAGMGLRLAARRLRSLQLIALLHGLHASVLLPLQMQRQDGSAPQGAG